VELTPALVPVVGDLLRRDVDESTAGRRLEVRQRGELSGRPVDGVLDRSVAAGGLLYPTRRQLQQLRQDELGALGVDPDGEADQTATRRTPA
jgi:hypothetical protein